MALLLGGQQGKLAHHMIGQLCITGCVSIFKGRASECGFALSQFNFTIHRQGFW
uniref:Uncharacterized protein n=2 Tax=Anguilla anguilla TaxID=7936 RepID=A0A0E9XU48_ANGAN